MAPLTLDEVVASVGQLPALPAVVDELIRAFENEAVGVDELAGGVAKDQALAARVLRVANSPFYGVQQKVASIHDAIVVLGFRAVGSLVMAASVTGYFSPAEQSTFDLAGFWRHSIGAALCAKALARRTGLDAESGFTAGLLHDIGRLMLVTTHSMHYAKVLAWREEHDCLIHRAERHVLGFDHAQAGEILARRWRFPPDIVRAVAQHHAPAAADARSLADVAHVANILAHALDLGGEAQAMVPPLDPGAWRRLGLDGPALKSMVAGIEREHESYCALLAPQAAMERTR